METNQFAEFVAAVVRSLPRDMDSTTAQGWIQNQASLANVLHKALAPKPEFQFKVGRTLKLGLFKTQEQYRQVLEAIGVQIGTYAGQILQKITVSKTVIEVDLSEPFTVADLGFTATTRYDAIKKRIVELGGGICPNEVGPAVRFQYQDQPKEEWFRVAMEGLPDADRDLRVFDVAHDGDGLWLSGGSGVPGALYSPDNRFVCLVPRKK